MRKRLIRMLAYHLVCSRVVCNLLRPGRQRPTSVLTHSRGSSIVSSATAADALVVRAATVPARSSLGCLLVLCMVAFGCVVSRSLEGAALGLHTFCGARSCIFVFFVGGISVSCCGCEPCLAGVVFGVALRVGVIFLLNLVSPV